MSMSDLWSAETPVHIPGVNAGGHIYGLHAAGTLVSDVGGVLLARSLAQRKAAKDYNDQPVSRTIGSENGRDVKDDTWMPAP